MSKNSKEYPVDPKFKKNRTRTIILIIVGICCLALVVFLIVNYIQKKQELEHMKSSTAALSSLIIPWLNF